MEAAAAEPRAQLARCLESGRIHSAYLLSGPGEAPREAAHWFARGLACATGGAGPSETGGAGPCESCRSCRISSGREEIALDGTGKSGPLLRHVGDHPDLLWIERGPADTRVRIGQVRALQAALRLRGSGSGRRAAVVADAEWLNVEAQNALLRLLEEPPPATTLILVTASSAGLLATVRSRCQRVRFAPERGPDPLGEEAPEEVRALVERLEELPRAGLPELLDWAEDYRGPRAPAAEAVGQLLGTASAWLRARVHAAVESGRPQVDGELEAFAALAACRRDLAQRNANPQMVAERALFALREAAAR